MNPEDREFREEVLQRLTRLETEVNNHLPSEIRGVKTEIHSLKQQFWGGVVFLFATSVGFNVWLIQRLIESGVVGR